MQDKTICVIGLGYIGLPTAALLANRGYKVHGVDVVQSTVDTCMGLTFKPDIDDLREAPASYITKRLIADGFDVLAVEPNIETDLDFCGVLS